MGCIQTSAEGLPISEPSQITHHSTLTVATLNYCGIMNSPFEFYCDDYLTELKDISKQFVSLIPTYFPDFDKTKFKWDMGKIDLKFRNRYSPMFYLHAGIENGKFMSKEAFEKKWEEVFQAQMPKLKMEYKESQKEVTKKYDLAMFHCLLRYVYRIVHLKESENLSTNLYIQKLQPLYNLSFLDEKRKSVKVIENFSKIEADIFFFQEYSQNFFDALKKQDNEYYLQHDQSKDTLIIAKKKAFKGKPANNELFLENHLGKELMTELNWAERTAFMVIDKYICICAHLTSKAEKNLPQIGSLKVSLIKVKQKLPDYDIILGGDLNSFLQPFSQKLHIFPTKTTDTTTVKKRTATQGQYNKAEKVVNESKDKIISSLPITEGKIIYITGKAPSNENLVPTDEHPFDHFVLVAKLQKRGQ